MQTVDVCVRVSCRNKVDNKLQKSCLRRKDSLSRRGSGGGGAGRELR